MQGHLRRLGEDGGVDVGDRESGVADLRADLAQEAAAVGVLVFRIAVRKMPADVAERGRPEERVAHRVNQDVGVGVPREPFLERNAHSAEDKLPALH